MQRFRHPMMGARLANLAAKAKNWMGTPGGVDRYRFGTAPPLRVAIAGALIVS
jgi:hypothetical protein